MLSWYKRKPNNKDSRTNILAFFSCNFALNRDMESWGCMCHETKYILGTCESWCVLSPRLSHTLFFSCGHARFTVPVPRVTRLIRFFCWWWCWAISRAFHFIGLSNTQRRSAKTLPLSITLVSLKGRKSLTELAHEVFNRCNWQVK